MEKKSFEDLVNLMTRLRAPGGCPWDREQTYQTLKPFLIEEAYEVVDAIDKGDLPALVEEIGDLLLQTVFMAEIGREEGTFEIADSITAIHDKLVRRHPHVFGTVEAATAGAVVINWEKLKRAERVEDEKGVMSGVPSALPALLKAFRMTEKAARVGFDWNRAEEVFAKVEEELGELKAAIQQQDATAVDEELGDLLFTVANLGRKLALNPEESLQGANRKFLRRFEWMESALRERKGSFEGMSLADLDSLWDEAKAAGL